MKNLKKALAFLLTAAMTMAMGMSSFANETPAGTETPAATETPATDGTGNGTITITPPAGLEDTVKSTYKIYKVFDASGNGTNISYRLVDGKTTAPAGFKVDTAGNVEYEGTAKELTAADITAIANYVTENDLVATVEAEGSAPVTTKGFPNGYFYITTTTGALVTINSTNPNAEVIDKNSIPQLNKKIIGASSYDTDGKNALAQVGTTVKYEVEITVGKGAENYEFHDVMGTGLSYNKDAAVTGIETSKYTIKDNPDKGDTITISFADGLAEKTKIIITYSATVTSDALQDNPAKNTATITYGEGHTTTESETKVYNANFTIMKQDGEGKALADAGFVIKNAENKYYKITEATESTPATVTWVDNIDDATEHFSTGKAEITDESGKTTEVAIVPAFTGLANGTYTVIEKTVPAGYNKAADQNFTIAEHNYTGENLKQNATIINQAGAVLPSTGGMGTTLFYTLGSLLVIGAGVLMVTRRRMELN